MLCLFPFVNAFVRRFHCAGNIARIFFLLFIVVQESFVHLLFQTCFYHFILFYLIFLLSNICIDFVFTHSNNYLSLIQKFSMFTFSFINAIIVFITCILFYVGYLFYFAVFIFIIFLFLLYFYYFSFFLANYVLCFSIWICLFFHFKPS